MANMIPCSFCGYRIFYKFTARTHEGRVLYLDYPGGDPIEAVDEWEVIGETIYGRTYCQKCLAEAMAGRSEGDADGHEGCE